jgi:hypothetical protein
MKERPDMTLPRVVLGLGALALGVGSALWFYSGISTGESGRYVYAGPLLLVALIPTWHGFSVCGKLMRGENPLASALRLTQPGGLSRLRARTSPGLFVAGMVSAAIGSVLFGLLSFLMLSSDTSYSDLRDTYYGMCFTVTPLWIGLGLCRALLWAGKKAPHVESSEDMPTREL